jgi:aldehyde dehydrogenase (NAD+)
MSKVEELPKYGNYIDGAVVSPASNEYLPTENPYTGEVWALIGRGGERDVSAAVAPPSAR